MITLKEIIIKRGDIEKIYNSNIKLTLWRAVSKSGVQHNPLYPDLSAKVLPNGELREPDVLVYKNEKAGKDYVKSEEGRGTSLTDREGLFGHKHWDYVVIPQGTIIPEELIITKDHYMPRKKCWHYSISPNFDLSKEDFLAALDELAKNARIKFKATIYG